jgi:hypothetical protein
MTDPQTRVSEVLYDDSCVLESLAHSLAFESILEDHQVERTVTAYCDDLDIDAKELPPELNEQYSFPSQFLLSDFSATFTTLREDDGKPTWVMDANYNINAIPFSMVATPMETVFETESYTGNVMRYRFQPSMSQRFLFSLALSGLRVGKGFVEPDEWPERADLKLARNLRLLGESHGNYKDRLVSFLPALNPPSDRIKIKGAAREFAQSERGLLVTYTQQETPRISGETLLYRMAWYLGDEMLTEAVSHQAEATGGGAVLANRFSGRRPGDYLPDDLVVGSMTELEEPDEGVVFDAKSDPIEYARVNATIVQLIKRYMQFPRYASLETN